MFEGHHMEGLTDAICAQAKSIGDLATAIAHEHHLSHDDSEVLDHLTTKLKSLASRVRKVAEGFSKLDAATDSKPPPS